MYEVAIYRGVLRVVPYVARLYGLFHVKAKKWIIGQSGCWQTLVQFKKQHPQHCIWFHASSLGEFEQARTLIEAMRVRYPDYVLLVTFFSSSGYEARKHFAHAHGVSYLPLDGPENSKRFVELIQPKVALFIRYDIWFFYLDALQKAQIPSYLVSAHFYPKSAYFKWYGRFLRKCLKKFTCIFTTDALTAEKLQKLQINALHTGDTRFDRVIQVAENIRPIPIIEKFKGNCNLWVLGSAWREDVAALLPLINDQHWQKVLQLKIILAPRYLDADTLRYMETQIKVPYVHYAHDAAQDFENAQVLILNTTGLLSAVYAYATFAFVGCSFAKGLHNTLEPGVFGIPVFFGPKYTGTKDKDPNILIKKGGMFAIKNASEARVLIEKFLLDKKWVSEVGSINQNYIMQEKGSTQKILVNLYF